MLATTDAYALVIIKGEVYIIDNELFLEEI